MKSTTTTGVHFKRKLIQQNNFKVLLVKELKLYVYLILKYFTVAKGLLFVTCMILPFHVNVKLFSKTSHHVWYFDITRIF